MTGPRYPWEALRVAAGAPSDTALGRRVGVSGTDLKRYRDTGLPEPVAEKYAVRCGLHPFDVWPEMVDDRIAEHEAAERSKAADRARQRYHADPAFRAAQVEKARRYYAEAGDYVRAQERRRYWADPEAARAARRERYRRNRDAELEAARRRRGRSSAA